MNKLRRFYNSMCYKLALHQFWKSVKVGILIPPSIIAVFFGLIFLDKPFIENSLLTTGVDEFTITELIDGFTKMMIMPGSIGAVVFCGLVFTYLVRMSMFSIPSKAFENIVTIIIPTILGINTGYFLALNPLTSSIDWYLLIYLVIHIFITITKPTKKIIREARTYSNNDNKDYISGEEIEVIFQPEIFTLTRKGRTKK